MSYTKNTWVDQDVERPKTYEVTNNQDGSITLTDSFGLVTELGTPVNAVNMNHIENGIDGCAIRKHNLTETFALGEWVLGGTGDDEGIYKSLVSNNVGNAISDDTKWEKVEMGGSSRNIGEIVASTLPLTDAGLHLLDGALLQYGSYQAFIDYIASIYSASANYFCTEAEWQQSVTTYGVCGKFVYDSVNNTVRLPKVTGIIEGTTDATALGDLVQAGLPPMTGSISIPRGFQDCNTNGTGALKYTRASASGNGLGNTDAAGRIQGTIEVNASWSSSIYGASSTVQPQTIKAFYYIVIATSTKTDIQVDIDEVVTDLNGKSDTDLSNVTDTGYIKMARASMPSNTYVDLTLNASGSTYTAPADGYVAFSKYATAMNQTINITCNRFISFAWAHTDSINLFTWMPVKKGDEFVVGYTAAGTYTGNYFRFIYAKGSESEAN